MHVLAVIVLVFLAVFNHGRPLFRPAPSGPELYCDAERHGAGFNLLSLDADEDQAQAIAAGVPPDE